MEISTSTYCRFCAQEKNCQDLLNLVEKEVLKEYLSFIEYLNINYLDLSQDNILPKTVCQSCYKEFHKACNFLKFVKHNQIVLNELYRRTGIAPTVKYECQDDVKVEMRDHFECDESELNNQIVLNEFDTIKECQDGIKDEMADHFEYDELELSSQNIIQGIENVIPDNSLKCEARGGWLNYSWSCCHCQALFKSMEDLRAHSKEIHTMCYAFQCSDCTEPFDLFNAFIGHVRQHQDKLRCYCQYCNAHFATECDCLNHSLTHWQGPEKICERCGQGFPSQVALDQHKRALKKYSLGRRKRTKSVVSMENKSWEHYDWACQDCFHKLPDADSLRRHVQQVHGKCFAMKCMDCFKVLKNFRFFVTHVVIHRPYLKKYCQYCNMYFKCAKDLTRHVEDHQNGDQRPCHGCGQIFTNNIELSIHMKQYNAPRLKRDLMSIDLTCDICFKVFNTLGHMKSHRKIHENRPKGHICETCGKGFYDNSQLQYHVKIHSENKLEICKVCNEAFNTKVKLKTHAATHLNLRNFICDHCGRGFKTKAVLKSHIVCCHMGVRRFKCKECGKEFKWADNFKSHMNRHTGYKPRVCCEMCDRSFSCWATCNKHMLKQHGVTLAKTKTTKLGRVAIDRKTGEPKEVASDQNTREWLSEIVGKRRNKVIVETIRE